MALVGSTFGFQPLIVPSCVAKMKIELAVFPFRVTSNWPVVFPITPVGVPVAVLPPAAGTVTTKPCFRPTLL